MKQFTQKNYPALIAWIVIVAVAIIAMPNVSQLVRDNGAVKLPNNVQSQVATRIEKQANGNKAVRTYTAVFSNGDKKLSQAQSHRIATQLTELKDESGLNIEKVMGPSDNAETKKQLIAKDGTTQLAQITVKQNGQISSQVKKLRNQLKLNGIDTYITGADALNDDFTTVTERGIQKTELIAVVFIFIVLILVFRSPIVPLISLLNVGVAFITSLSIVMNLAAHLNFPLSNFTQVFLVIVLFGIGTDYNILLYDYFKGELAKGVPVLEATRATRKHGGRTVLYSGLSVLIGFTSLWLAKFSFYQSASAVAIGVLVLLPVLLTLNMFFMTALGPKMFWPSKVADGQGSSKLWHGLSRAALAQPVVALAVIFAIGVPAALGYDSELNFNNADEVPSSYQSKAGYVVIQDHFPKGMSAPATIYIKSDTPLNTQGKLAAIDDLTQYLQKEPGVKTVASVTEPGGSKIESMYLGDQLKTITSGLKTSKAGLAKIQKGLQSANTQLSNANLSGSTAQVQKLADGTSDLQEGAEQLNSGVKTYTAGVASANAAAQQVASGNSTLAGSTQTAANGANQVNSAAQQVAAGSSTLAGSTQTAANGANQVNSAAQQVASGSSTLAGSTQTAANGANQVNSAAQQVASGANQVNGATQKAANGSKQLNTAANQIASGASAASSAAQQASAGAQSANSAAQQVASGSNQLASAVSGSNGLQASVNSVSGAVNELATNGTKVSDGLTQLNSQMTQLQSQASQLLALLKLIDSGDAVKVQQAATALKQLTDGANALSSGMSTLNTQMPKLNSGAGELATNLNALAGGATKLADGTNSLATGAAQLAAGNKTLADSTQQLANATGSLATGAGQLASGTGTLASGSSQLANGTGTLASGLGALNSGAGQLASGSGQLANGTGTLASGLGALNSGTGRLASGSGQLANGTGTLASGLGALNSGASKLANGSGQLAAGTNKLNSSSGQLTSGTNTLASGTSQVNAGVQQMNTQLKAMSAKVSELGSGLDQADSGLTALEKGNDSMNAYLTEMQNSYMGNAFYLPKASIKSKAFKPAIDTYMADGKKITSMTVVFKGDPNSTKANAQFKTLDTDLNAKIKHSALRNSTVAIGGQTSQDNDLRKLANGDFQRTATIMIIGISIALIIVTQSLLQPLTIIGTLVTAFFASMSLTRLISIHMLGDNLLSWNTPFFTFIMLMALGVDYSIFLMIRFKDNKLEPDIKQRMLQASTTIGAVVISAAIILSGTFAALIPSGVTTLIQVALGVIIGLVILVILLPIAMSGLISLNEWHEHKEHETVSDTSKD
ncbi:MMPL family transporter [Lacticaseibacillus sp. GG6-2]